jgi:hypothetical protein
MARNVKHAGKVSGSAQIESGEPFGTTFQRSSTHAPELRKGVSTSQKGKVAVNGVVAVAEGPTFTCNDPAISFPSRPAPVKHSKVIADREGSGMAPPRTVPGTATGAASSDHLKRSYEKSGRTDSKAARALRK